MIRASSGSIGCRNRSRRAAVVAAVVACAAIGAAVVASNSGAAPGAGAAPKAGTSAVLGQLTDFAALDWQRRGGVIPHAAGFPAYDRLVAYSEDKKTVLPYLATKWVVTPADRPKQITFTLRRDAKCSDGTPVTPLVVLNSYQRYITVPKIVSAMGWLFGPGPYSVSANVKKWTFTFKTQTPFNTLLNGFAETGVICPAGLKALETDPDALMKNQYGSGPYTMVSTTPRVEIVWKKRPGWKWGPPGVNPKNLPDTLTWKVVPDATTLANLLITGGVDFATLSGPDVPRLIANGSLRHKTLQNYSPTMLIFNQRPERPGSDERVRAALIAAFDPKAFAQAAWQGRATVVPSSLNPSMRCFNKKVYDLAPKGPGPAKARKMLEAAGYKAGSGGIMTKDGKPLRMRLVTTPVLFGGGGEFLASQWRAAGVDVDLQDLTPTSAWVAQLFPGNFDAALSAGYLFAPIPWFQFSTHNGAPPPKGGNYAVTGTGIPRWDRLGLWVSQYSDCKFGTELQELMLKRSIAFPVAQQKFDSFGNKKWEFPADLQTFDPLWLKPGR
jgi:peptide/nickel transport system substrate-binding protein